MDLGEGELLSMNQQHVLGKDGQQHQDCYSLLQVPHHFSYGAWKEPVLLQQCFELLIIFTRRMLEALPC